MGNKRVIYSVKQVGIKQDGIAGSFTEVHGAQSCGITTNFNLEQVFELGQIAIYENIENIPDVEVTLEKVLDGYPLIYHLGTLGSTSASLSGRSNAKAVIAMSIFDDTQDSSSGTPVGQVEMSGMFVSALSYNFTSDGNSTESVTFVGNNKVWRSSGYTFTGAFDNTDQPYSIYGSGGVNRREDFLFAPAVTQTGVNPGYQTRDVNGQVITTDFSIMPTQIGGISTSGTNDFINGQYGAHIQSVSISTNLGRDQLLELGRRAPYHRFVNFPTEVTTEIVTNCGSGDFISATEAGGQNGAPTGSNLKDQSIRIKMREGTFINLGTKNKINSINEGGGDAGGGNETITYTFTNFNDLTVTHPRDPSGF